MIEFAGLSAKMYLFTVEGDEKSASRANGISTILTKTLTIDGYNDALF